MEDSPRNLRFQCMGPFPALSCGDVVNRLTMQEARLSICRSLKGLGLTQKQQSHGPSVDRAPPRSPSSGRRYPDDPVAAAGSARTPTKLGSEAARTWPGKCWERSFHAHSCQGH